MSKSVVASDSSPQAGALASEQSLDWRWLAVSGIALLALLSLAANPSMPWESDHATKAAQIMEIANRRDFLLSDDLPDYYRLRLFPLYYSVSGLMEYATGAEIFSLMNYTSAVWGAIAGVALAAALRRTFGVHPLWTTFVLLAMPLFVITFSYGNEISWALGLFCCSLALAARPGVASQTAAGAAVAAAVMCRLDVVLLAPFWLGWTLLFGQGETPQAWWRRLIAPTIGFLVVFAVVWMLLVRRPPVDDASATFGFNFNPLLAVAYFTYPFNPSIVLVGGIGWLFLWKLRRPYALVHLLLLIPAAYYFRHLSTPKYIIWMLIFYGLPTAVLLQHVRRSFQAAIVAFIAIWAVFGISNYGVFGPAQASLWYVPTADGPCPIGGYVDFYRREHRGDYQSKQQAYLDQMRELVKRGHQPDDKFRVVGHWSHVALPFLGASGELGDDEKRRQWEEFAASSLKLGGDLNDNGQRLLMSQTGYSDLSHTTEEFATQIRDWLGKGQVRAHLLREGELIPLWIEIGTSVPENENPDLGKRLLRFLELYQNQMVFPQQQFVGAYKSSAWVPASRVSELQATGEPLYQDAEAAAFDRAVEGAELYGFPWPERYYRMKSPKVQHNLKKSGDAANPQAK
ncbi:hypothetical protein [Lacipirellula parvula]|uniref:Glycosyltransferase RgtA/B/C/D-like domain-containing protein n=1 Tax=Lacipirellula parvula TaxID=2650471 RepID=A0A5K7XA46_9BACT|nr:hypothetical protein [Lacipirellula parvula]BBO33285.1 hypothetical protein PLANPX_2897 [Lacipirellula parvula]